MVSQSALATSGVHLRNGGTYQTSGDNAGPLNSLDNIQAVRTVSVEDADSAFEKPISVGNIVYIDGHEESSSFYNNGGTAKTPVINDATRSANYDSGNISSKQSSFIGRSFSTQGQISKVVGDGTSKSNIELVSAVGKIGEPLELREYENPQPKGDEVLVKITACGVCHSDLHLADGYFDLGDGKRITLADRGTKLPFTPGHEITGTVVALGENVKDIKIGDAGIVFPWIGCGKCAACLENNETLCEAPKYLGARLDGGYSDHIIVPHSKYIVSYGDMDPAQAAPYACSCLLYTSDAADE